MSSAVLLSFDCLLRIIEFSNPKRQEILIMDTPDKKVYAILMVTKNRTYSSDCIRLELMCDLLFMHFIFLFENPSRNMLPQFTGAASRPEIHKIIKESLQITDPQHHIKPHSFRRGGATRAYQLKRLS